MTLQKIAIGTAEAITMNFCQRGRADRNATAPPTAINVISDRSPAQASATLRVRVSGSPVAATTTYEILVPKTDAFTRVISSTHTATCAANCCNGPATRE